VKQSNVKLHGHIGTWYVIDVTIRNGEKYYLFESEIFGDEAPCIITDANYQIIYDEVYNGWEDMIS